MERPTPDISKPLFTQIMQIATIAILALVIICVLGTLAWDVLYTLFIVLLLAVAVALFAFGVTWFPRGKKLLGTILVMLSILSSIGAGVAISSAPVSNSHLVPGP